MGSEVDDFSRTLLLREEPLLASVGESMRGGKDGDRTSTIDPETFSVLNTVLPPIITENEDGSRMIQYAKSSTSTREDVDALQSGIEEVLFAKQAREYPVCPVREEVFSEAFDELVRQVLIECPERGVLLARVRDELRMSLSAYLTLYHDSLAYGVERVVVAERDLSGLRRKVELLEAERNRWQVAVAERRTLAEVGGEGWCTARECAHPLGRRWRKKGGPPQRSGDNASRRRRTVSRRWRGSCSRS